MALAARAIHWPAYAPIDEATRPELLEPGKAVLAAYNVRPTEPGGYEPRRGFDAFGDLNRIDGTSRSAAYKQFAHDKQVCVIGDGPSLDSYSYAAQAWSSRGRVPEATLRMIGLPGVGGSTAYVSDVIVCGAFIVALTVGVDGVSAVVLDAITGAVVRSREVVDSTTTDIGLLATEGSYVYAFFCPLGGTSTVTYRSIDLSTASSVSAGWSIAANAATDGVALYTNLYISTASLSDRVALAYINNSAGTSQLSVKTFQSGTSLGSATINTSSVLPTQCAIAPDGAGGLLVAWNESNSVKVCGLSAALATTSTTTSLLTSISASGTAVHQIDVCGSGTAGSGRVFANYSTDTAGDAIIARNFTTATGAITASGAQVSAYNARKISRVFRVGTRYYALCRSYEVAKKDAVVCDLSDANAWLRPVANIRPNLATGKACSQVPAYSGKYLVPLTTQTSGSTFAGELAELDFYSTQRWQPVRFGRSTFLSGSLLSEFDGHRVFESAFLVHPPKPTTSLGGTGFSSTNCRYVAVYEHADANGNWHVSGVSDPSATVSPANQTVTVTVRPLGISSRVTAAIDPIVRISIYRTLTGGEPPYYLVDSVANDLSAATQTYADSSTDTTIQTHAKLYAPSLPGINGGSQDHRAPPGLTHIEAGNGVLVGAQGEDVYGSSADVSGEGTWWSPIWQQPVSGDGEITGVKFQDGTFYIFKRRAIYAMSAEPPSDNGAIGGLGVPARLAADVGCIDARSLVVTSLGIFFQSERGIELLTRARSVEPIGTAIQDTVEAFPVCSSAVVDPLRDVVYVELAEGEANGLVTGNGRAAVFDLSMKAWVSTDRRYAYAGTADAPTQSSCMMWNGTAYRYGRVEAGGRVAVEWNNHWDNFGDVHWLTPTVEYPPLKLGLQQRAHFWDAVALVEREDASGFKVEHAYDWADYDAANDKTWTEARTADKRQLHWTLKSGERQSVRMRVSMTEPSSVGTGRALTLVGFSVDTAPMSGSTKNTPNLDPSARQ